MPKRTLPGLGLTGFWDLGSDNWKDENDANLRTLSALVQARAISRSTALPAAPANGDIYIVPPDAATNANEIAIRDDGAWVYIAPAEGFTAYVSDANENVQFDGTAWAPLEAGIEDAPTDGTLYGRKDGAWATVPAGGGGDARYFTAFAGGVLIASETLFAHVFAAAGSLPAGLAGSRARAGVAANGAATLSVRKNGTEVGTISFAAGATTATFAMASATAFAAGDLLSITAPGTADATLADVALTLVGTLESGA